MEDLGLVVIGRNEGARLVRCLESVVGSVHRLVYVDSGSTDGSVEMARGKGAEVVELDMSRPFSMARARNAGFHRLTDARPELLFAAFVDGDCEVRPEWLVKARETLLEDESVGIVTGHRRERERDATIYNRLTDMDWVRSPGEIPVAGGDVVIRVEAFRKVDGFDETLSGAEDPDISVRIREEEYRIIRLDMIMTFHDIAMTKFAQWWRRTIRSGRDVGEMSYRHGKPGYPFAKSARSNWIWGLLMPALALGLAWPTRGLSVVALVLLHGLWAARVARYRHGRFGDSWGDSLLYGSFTMLGKFPCAIGQLKYRWSRITKKRAGLIEYH